MVPAKQSLDADHAPALRRHDGLIVQIEIVRADRTRKLAMDEFLIGGNRIDGKLERDDRARPSFRRGTSFMRRTIR